MRKNHVVAVWLVGVVAAIAVYLLGSDWLLAALTAIGEQVARGLDTLLHLLESLTAGLLRALAIGLFVTFVGLSVLAIRNGRRGRLALVLISAGFLWLVGSDASRQDWIEALLLAAVAATVMTQRLLSTPRPG